MSWSSRSNMASELQLIQTDDWTANSTPSNFPTWQNETGSFLPARFAPESAFECWKETDEPVEFPSIG